MTLPNGGGNQSDDSELDGILDWLAEMHSTKPRGWNDTMVTDKAKTALLTWSRKREVAALEGLPHIGIVNENGFRREYVPLSEIEQRLAKLSKDTGE